MVHHRSLLPHLPPLWHTSCKLNSLFLLDWLSLLTKMPHPTKQIPHKTACIKRWCWHLTACSLASSTPWKSSQMYQIYSSRHSPLPFLLCPCHSNSPHGKNLTIPQFLSTPWISLSQFSVDLSPLMSSLFLIWAVDPSPFYKPSKASQQTLYCGTRPTSSNLFHLSPRWWRWRWRRQRLRVQRQRRWRWRWQWWQNRHLRRLLKLREGRSTTQCFVLAFLTTFHRWKHPTHPYLFFPTRKAGDEPAPGRRVVWCFLESPHDIIAHRPSASKVTEQTVHLAFLILSSPSSSLIKRNNFWSDKQNKRPTKWQQRPRESQRPVTLMITLKRLCWINLLTATVSSNVGHRRSNPVGAPPRAKARHAAWYLQVKRKGSLTRKHSWRSESWLLIKSVSMPSPWYPAWYTHCILSFPDAGLHYATPRMTPSVNWAKLVTRQIWHGKHLAASMVEAVASGAWIVQNFLT